MPQPEDSPVGTPLPEMPLEDGERDGGKEAGEDSPKEPEAGDQAKEPNVCG